MDNHSSKNDPLYIYIHIPFCIGKCAYCAFNSRPAKNPGEISKYIRSVGKEITGRSSELTGKTIQTIYYGGGTPSICSAADIQYLIEQIKFAARDIDQGAEITIEANPETLSKEKLDALKIAGINRVNIGIQSFDENVLSFLGRNHTSDQAKTAIQKAMDSGFENIGLDLIVGLPSPLTNIYQKDIDRAVALAPKHLSVYMLGIEEPSEFYNQQKSGLLSPIDENQYADIYTECHEKLTTAGYVHYEISNYCQPGFESKHNSAYWNQSPYVGFGAGAHSYLLSGLRPERKANFSDPDAYMLTMQGDHSPLEFSEIVTEEMEIREQLMLSLRTGKGVAPGDFGDFDSIIGKELFALVDDGLYKWNGERFSPTLKGYLVADGIAVFLWEKLFG